MNQSLMFCYLPFGVIEEVASNTLLLTGQKKCLSNGRLTALFIKTLMTARGVLILARRQSLHKSNYF